MKKEKFIIQKDFGNMLLMNSNIKNGEKRN